ncbi:sulfatase-like hydrolase/transferase [Xenorhabdus budapestensis]|uniref:sulfatase-like hydrolase/transferase n=1 Tax=Xenorhabdus budapestensis TaxID=290110 RepID=UPI003A89479C
MNTKRQYILIIFNYCVMKFGSKIIVYFRVIIGVLMIVLTFFYWPPTILSVMHFILISYTLSTSTILKIVVIVGIFSLSFAVILLAAFTTHRLRWWLFLLISLSLMTSAVFYQVTGHTMGYPDWLTLWRAKANINDAFYEYLVDFFEASLRLIPLVLGFALIPETHRSLFPWVTSLFLLSVAVFITVNIVKQAGATNLLPSATSLYGMMISSALDNQSSEYIYTTNIQPNKTRQADHIILIVDESIRYDFFKQIVLSRLSMKDWYVYDFGIATAMANCSAESNIMLRKFVEKNTITHDVYNHPLIWNLAHNAGFTTWLLDAQRNGKGHNYFDAKELSMIDYKPNIRTEHDISLVNELRTLPTDKPSFTYIIKIGSHFPYENRYPVDFQSDLSIMEHPYIRNNKKRQQYVNAIDYQTGQFFEQLSKVKLPERTIIFYTSDHGQNVGDELRKTHCSSSSRPLVDEGIVPLLVLANFDITEMNEVVQNNYNRMSHFDMMKTIIDFLGYGYVENKSIGLLRTDNLSFQEFLYGSAFGYFNSPIKTMPVNTDDYQNLENARWNITH